MADLSKFIQERSDPNFSTSLNFSSQVVQNVSKLPKNLYSKGAICPSPQISHSLPIRKMFQSFTITQQRAYSLNGTDITTLRERPKYYAMSAFAWALGTNIGVGFSFIIPPQKE